MGLKYPAADRGEHLKVPFRLSDQLAHVVHQLWAVEPPHGGFRQTVDPGAIFSGRSFDVDAVAGYQANHFRKEHGLRCVLAKIDTDGLDRLTGCQKYMLSLHRRAPQKTLICRSAGYINSSS